MLSPQVGQVYEASSESGLGRRLRRGFFIGDCRSSFLCTLCSIWNECLEAWKSDAPKRNPRYLPRAFV